MWQNSSEFAKAYSCLQILRLHPRLLDGNRFALLEHYLDNAVTMCDYQLFKKLRLGWLKHIPNSILCIYIYSSIDIPFQSCFPQKLITTWAKLHKCGCFASAPSFAAACKAVHLVKLWPAAAAAKSRTCSSCR